MSRHSPRSSREYRHVPRIPDRSAGGPVLVTMLDTGRTLALTYRHGDRSAGRLLGRPSSHSGGAPTVHIWPHKMAHGLHIL